uniref:Uncharacterized protein n=1 Tax=Oryza glumipatula TaxID=40148 RepID=A0A0E0B7H9_9ORYZ
MMWWRTSSGRSPSQSLPASSSTGGRAREALYPSNLSGMAYLSKNVSITEAGSRNSSSRLTNLLNGTSGPWYPMESNSTKSALMHGTVCQRLHHRRDSTHVCTAWRAFRKDMMRWRISSGRSLSLSLPAAFSIGGRARRGISSNRWCAWGAAQ